MSYPEQFIAPMRAELTRVGVRELRSPAEVDEAVQSNGTVMVVVNSICGCAAGKARPGIAMALQHPRRPDVVATVFAGADLEATERAREELRTVSAVVTVRGAVARWRVGVDDAAAGHRNARRERHRAAADRGFRPVLHAGTGRQVTSGLWARKYHE